MRLRANKYFLILIATAFCLCGGVRNALAQQGVSTPIAIVPIVGKDAPQVTGSLEVVSGRAMIGTSGSVTAGESTAELILPHRGKLLVCASTTVKLTSDSSVPHGEVPGLMIAFEHGALETNYATGRNSDIVLTPDFRILIGGPGASEVKIRLGEHGDTCIDNPGKEAPFVVVTSLFEGGAYRVQPGQRVMFQHGSLHEVVDQEKEPCGCPPPLHPGTNEFPMAQSAGLAPLTPTTAALQPQEGTGTAIKLEHAGQAPDPATQTAPQKPASQTTEPAKEQKPAEKKRGFLSSIGHFFSHIFGAE